MRRSQGWTIGLVTSLMLWAILIGGTCAMVGCGDPMTEGILIGLGSSTATQEASDMAQESKTALVAKILQLKHELEAAATPEQQAALQEQLDATIKKQEYVELTATITDQIKAGLDRDWGDKPTSPDNLAWILGAAATAMTGLAGKKTYDDKKKADALNRVKVASKTTDAMKTGDVYKAINGA